MITNAYDLFEEPGNHPLANSHCAARIWSEKSRHSMFWHSVPEKIGKRCECSVSASGTEKMPSSWKGIWEPGEEWENAGGIAFFPAHVNADASALSKLNSWRLLKLIKIKSARSRLYRSQILQVNTCWKALAEIYTMHSFAPFSWYLISIF